MLEVKKLKDFMEERGIQEGGTVCNAASYKLVYV